MHFSWRNIAPNKTMYREILKIGIPGFVFQLLASVSMGLTNTAASVYGDSAVAAMGIVTRILALGTYVILGFIRAFQPVVGYNYGAKQYSRLNETIRVSIRWTTVFCCISALLMIGFSPVILSWFSEDPAVISMGSKALRANGVTFAFYGFALLYGALFLALGREEEGGLLSLSRQGFFFIPLILVLPKLGGMDGIVYAQPMADVLTILLTAVFALGIRRKTLPSRSAIETQ